MAKVAYDIIGKDKASKATSNVTKSMITAQLAVQAFNKAAQVLSKTIKESISAYVEQEKQNKRLESVLKSTKNAVGLTAKEISQMSMSLADVTTFGDEAILSAQNILLTFTKIGNDTFPSATESVLNMSEALGTDLKNSSIQIGKALNDPIQGISSLSRAGVQFTAAQKEMIKGLVESNDIADAQAIILKELETQFGGAAIAARDTFGGALKTLKNVQGDLMEGFGRIVAIIGRDIVENIIKGTKAITDFITNAKTLETVITIFEVSKEIIKDVFLSWKESISTAVEPFIELISTIKEQFSPLLKSLGIRVEKTGGIFGLLGRQVAKVTGFMKLAGDVSKFLTNIFINLTKTAGALGRVLARVFIFDFAGAKEEFSSVQESFSELSKNIQVDASNIFDTIQDNVTNLTSQTNKFTDKYVDIVKNAQDKVKKFLSDTSPTDNFIQNHENVTSNVKNTYRQLNKNIDEALSAQVSIFKAYFSSVINVATSSLTIIRETWNQYFSEQSRALTKHFEAQIKSNEEYTNRQLEIEGVAQETQIERLQNQLITLQESLATAQTLEDESAIQNDIRDTQKELRRAQILEEGAKREAKIKEKALKEEESLKKKQFQQNKDFSIANVWTNAASSVMGWWASFAPMGIPGIALAAVMTAATLAQAGAQTGRINSQKFQAGGVIRGNQTRGDNIPVQADAGEVIIAQKDFHDFMELQRSGTGVGNIIIENMKVMTNNAEDFVNQLIELKRFEAAR